MTVKTIGTAPFTWAKKLAVVCLVFDTIVLALIAGIGLERKQKLAPIQELGRIQAELTRLKP